MRLRSARRAEWERVAPTGCDRATSLALLHLGCAYTCDGRCHMTYFGSPRHVVLHKDKDGGVLPILYCQRCGTERQVAAAIRESQ
jgi:hypothetical protein